MIDRVSISGSLPGSEPVKPKQESKEQGNFMDTLKSSLEEVDRLQQEAEGAVKDFVTGQSGTVHDVFLAMEKAEVSFRMVMRVRDKLLDAYQEIMRMQL